MNIEENISLKHLNTFGIDAYTAKYFRATSIDKLCDFLENNTDFFILNGGSNILITSNIDITTLHIDLKGINILKETDNHIFIKAQAGENWHEFVLWCIENNFGGLENLSLIPGNVGTSPIQNIGAYGVELKDVFYKLKAIEIATQKRRVFTKEECKFGYRNSVFKNELKGKYIITSVIFKLTKKNHNINSSYGAIQNELENNNITQPTIQDISKAVIAIRESKLPDPKKIGNSGSFFKNPVISKLQFEELQQDYPSIPSYTVSDTEIKVPAGWLIEQYGFKGKRFGDAGVHEKQALVLVNYGNATGLEILNLAKKIRASVADKFNITLEFEVNII